MKNLKSLVKTTNFREFSLEESAIPTLHEEQILIKVKYCGVCGSDLHAASHAPGYEFVTKPIILGHEFSGEIIQVNSLELKNLLGKYVVVLPGITCGTCDNCRKNKTNICSSSQAIGLHQNGGMTEYFVTVKEQVLVLPEKLSLDVAALIEPLSVALHAVSKIDKKQKNKKVLITGCGIIGILVGYLATKMGADVTISGLEKDLEFRLSKAKDLGMNIVLTKTLEDKSIHFDFVYECSGSTDALNIAINKLNKGGDLIIVALYERDYMLSLNNIVRREISMLTSYASTLEDFKESINFILKDQELFRSLISKYDLEEGQRAFDDAYKQSVLKPLLKM